MIAEHKEISDLCKSHIEECENMEKKRSNDVYTSDRVELLSGGNSGNIYVNSKCISFMYLQLIDV